MATGRRQVRAGVREGWGLLERVRTSPARAGNPDEVVLELGAPGGSAGVPPWERDPQGLQTAEWGPREAGGKGWLAACLLCAWYTQRTPPCCRGGPRLRRQRQLLACSGSRGSP